MQRVAYWLFPLIAVAVAIFIVVFMFQINSSGPLARDEAATEEHEGEKSAPDGNLGWLKRFSLEEDKGYYYPVNELILKLDTEEGKKPDKGFRLSAPLNNSNELTSLEDELKKNKLPYSLQKEGDVMTLVVDSSDQAGLASLVTKLKTYQITATVSPLIEEK